MALYAFDGTGNEDRPGEDRDSNVFDFYEAYIDPRKNTDPDEKLGSLYLKGIGKRAQTLVGDKVAEAFGIGGHRRVRQAMDRLENNIEAGDSVIDIVGFSRGAALAISFANEIAKKIPNAAIHFIGVWDVVGQFGAPGRVINAGHDLHFPPNVEHCFHAMALDESRALFPLTRLGKGRNTSEKLQEVWFRGVHSDVGGGNGNIGMNWIALNWMYEAARRCDIRLDEAAVAKNLIHKTAGSADQRAQSRSRCGADDPAKRSAPLERAADAGYHRPAAQQPDVPLRAHRRCRRDHGSGHHVVVVTT